MRSDPRFRLTTLAALFLSSLLTAAAWSQPPEGGQERFARHRADRGSRLFEILELSEAQQEEWKAAQESSGVALKDLHSQLRDNRNELHDEIESDAPNPTRIGELTLAGRDLRREVEAVRADLQADLEAILTPDQLEKWQTYRAAREDRRGRFGRRGPRGFRGPGPGANG